MRTGKKNAKEIVNVAYNYYQKKFLKNDNEKNKKTN